MPVGAVNIQAYFKRELGEFHITSILESLDNRNFPKDVELSKGQSSGNELGTRIHQNGGGAKRSR